MQSPIDIRPLLIAALAEDIGAGDITSNATIPADARAKFAMNARQPMVTAGLVFLPELFAMIDADVRVTLRVEDGVAVEAGATLATLEGPARALLAGERVALNLVQQLSGVATLTAQYVAAVSGTHAQILDTRKTVLGLRAAQKYAVRCGGGTNHRMGLYDAVLIKDNHIAVAGGVAVAVEAAREYISQLSTNGEAGAPLPAGEAGLLSVPKARFSNPGEGAFEQASSRPHPDLQPHHLSPNDIPTLSYVPREVVGANPTSPAGRGAPASRAVPTIEVECDTLAQLTQALVAGVDVVLLDNMNNDQLREAVAKVRDQNAVTGQVVKTEASGNVSLETVRAIAETGVDYISVGKLTHSAVAVDVGLDEG